MSGHDDLSMFGHSALVRVYPWWMNAILSSNMSKPSKPRHGDIARHLTEAITSGHFPVGSFLPNEHELVEHYKTSRHTVRAALSRLQELGLVSRRKNVGTRVESAKARDGFRPSLASVDDLVQFGADTVRHVQSIEAVDVDCAVATDLRCREGTAWLRISSLRLEGGAGTVPVGWTDVYVDPAYAEIAALVKESPTSLISTLIEARYGRRIAEIQQDVRATNVQDAGMALALAIKPGAAALKIVRRYLDEQGVTFEVSVSLHPAERFCVSMRLQRSGS